MSPTTTSSAVTVSKGTMPGVYASVVPTGGVAQLKDILAGSKMPAWVGVVIAVVIVVIMFGGVLVWKLTKRKNKMPDIETASQKSGIGSQSGQAFIARYLAVCRSIIAVIPGTSQVPTRDDIELAESLPSATPAPPAAPKPATLKYAHGRTAAHFANYKRLHKGNDNHEQATRNAIDRIQSQATYERNHNPFHPRYVLPLPHT